MIVVEINFQNLAFLFESFFLVNSSDYPIPRCSRALKYNINQLRKKPTYREGQKVPLLLMFRDKQTQFSPNLADEFLSSRSDSAAFYSSVNIRYGYHQLFCFHWTLKGFKRMTDLVEFC